MTLHHLLELHMAGGQRIDPAVIIMKANPLFQWINAWEAPLTVRFVAMVTAALCIVIPVSLLSFHLIEQPFVNLSKKLVRRCTNASTPNSQISMLR